MANNNPTGINQYTKGGRKAVKSTLFQASFNGRPAITIGDQAQYLKKMKALARGGLVSNRITQSQRRELAGIIKAIRNKR